MPFLPVPCRAIASVGFARVMLLTLLPLAPAAIPAPRGGGITEAQAISLFKAAIATEMQTLKSQLVVSKKSFLAAISAYEVSVNLGLDLVMQTEIFYTDCADLQFGVQDVANAALLDIGNAAASTLQSLANGTPLQGIYPKDFYAGGGGALDKAMNDVKSHVSKLYKPLANRLRKTATLLAKHGAALTVDLRPPALLEDLQISEGISSFLTSRLGLDTVVAVNRNEPAADGRVWLSGAAYASIDDVNVTVTGPEADFGNSMTSDNRWAVFMTDAGTFFAKGNYLASIRAGTDDAALGCRFSFR